MKNPFEKRYLETWTCPECNNQHSFTANVRSDHDYKLRPSTGCKCDKCGHKDKLEKFQYLRPATPRNMAEYHVTTPYGQRYYPLEHTTSGKEILMYILLGAFILGPIVSAILSALF